MAQRNRSRQPQRVGTPAAAPKPGQVVVDITPDVPDTSKQPIGEDLGSAVAPVVHFETAPTGAIVALDDAVVVVNDDDDDDDDDDGLLDLFSETDVDPDAFEHIEDDEVDEVDDQPVLTTTQNFTGSVATAPRTKGRRAVVQDLGPAVTVQPAGERTYDVTIKQDIGPVFYGEHKMEFKENRRYRVPEWCYLWLTERNLCWG